MRVVRHRGSAPTPLATIADKETVPRLRELDSRAGNGLEVSLLWSPESNQLAVLVIDEQEGEEFAFEVAAGEAMDVFRHPYAYVGARQTAYYHRSREARAA
jgi:hypothetical protein